MSVRAMTPADDRFDDLARSFAKGTVSRRRTLALIGSSLFGGALGGVSLFDDAAAASCRKKCKKKEGDAKKRCKRKCKKKEKQPKFDCQNLGTACGLGSKTLVCNCRLDKEGNQTCANVVNPPDGMAFQPCVLSSDCPSGQICDFGGNVCRTKCETG